ncbi:hypothetical protein [Xanthomonas arboricola]|uniref:hypothetical protein n=1 Tax=Xanthomonas arboricola TaxID=56448 RepID=UPI002B2D15AD|nr:hypothetical protein X12_001573 [Xanthomonas arboricola]
MSRASSRFSDARAALMLPIMQTEAHAVAEAMHFLRHGLDSLPDDVEFSGENTHLIEELRGLMDTSGLSDPGDQGLALLKAQTLTVDQRSRFSVIVDELCYQLDAFDNSHA